MKRIVQKFGGTSLATIDLIKKAALHTKYAWDQGNQIAVVVSAMAGTTNELVKWVQQTKLSHALSMAESEAVLAAGEQITSGLFALCLQEYGIPSRSWQGWQLPIQTKGPFGAASIEQINTQPLLEGFCNREVPIIAGFQGIEMQNQRITTLGRGGSDTTAVALAAALRADYCAIFTDVDGIYTADPQFVPKAKKISFIEYEEMLEMASSGAKVLHPRSVEIALQHQVQLWVLSSFLPVNDYCGTWIMNASIPLESTGVTALSYQLEYIRMTLISPPDHYEFLEQLMSMWCTNHIIVEDLTHYQDKDIQKTCFFVHKNQQEIVVFLLQKNQHTLKISQWTQQDDIAKISLVGHGLKRDTKILHQLLAVLQTENVAIFSLMQTERTIIVTILKDQLEFSLRLLHKTYHLEQDTQP